MEETNCTRVKSKYSLGKIFLLSHAHLDKHNGLLSTKLDVNLWSVWCVLNCPQSSSEPNVSQYFGFYFL